MKKVLLSTKLIAVVAITALVLSVVSFVLVLRLDDLVRNDLLNRAHSNSGAINTIVDCYNNDKKTCDVEKQ